jgi:hypothetical protein
MDFFDKLALAMGVWGFVVSFLGGGVWLIEGRPVGKPFAYGGCALLVAATFIWVSA